jgi:hypothetical protein
MPLHARRVVHMGKGYITGGTELSSTFTVAQYKALRPGLDTGDQIAWDQLVDAVHQRIEQRFLLPAKELERYDGQAVLPFRPGFVITAVDCLLIDAIQAFREGRTGTEEAFTAKSFSDFFRSQRFSDMSRANKDDLFSHVRNGIFHNGETRKDWKIRRGTGAQETVFKDSDAARVLNRTKFHRAVAEEFEEQCDRWRGGKDRPALLARMNALAGMVAPPMLYFAYGSNMHQAELAQRVPSARFIDRAYLARRRFAYAKHSVKRECDAATIVEDDCAIVWGALYEMDGREKPALDLKEHGYRDIDVHVVRVSGEQARTFKARTYEAEELCPAKHGPSVEYRKTVVTAARGRHLPERYCAWLETC